MKTIIKVALLFLITSCSKKAVNDPVACKEVEDRLIIIENYINGKDPDPHLKRVEAVFFLDELTGIVSESGGNDVGTLYPTAEDYKKWTHWYDINRNKLHWDTDKQQVILKE